MKKRESIWARVGILAGLCGVFAVATPSHADSISVAFDTGVTQVTTGLTGSATNGAMMDGMSVTATFSDSSTETAIWGDTGADSGAAFGAGWSLSEVGDTFNGTWTLTNSSGLSIENLFIDAGLGDSVFDINIGGFGTDGSANGRTFELTGGQTGLDVVATYSDIVALTGDAPVGDLWRNLSIDFNNAGGFGTGRTLTFRTDTDSLEFAGDIAPVPEPASITLLGLGLAGLIARRRRS